MQEQNFNFECQNDWIGPTITALKESFNTCEENKETTLCMYIEAVLRLLNTLAAIPLTSLHSYEKHMFLKPMEVFARLFCCAISNACNCITPEKKRKIISEIEFGVKNVVNIYQSLIDATSNSNHEMFVNPTLEARIYEVSPKISLYYAKLLDEISRTLTGTDNYAFMLAPSLLTKIETYELFDRQVSELNSQKEDGQLIVIYIPEAIIDQVDIVPIALFHEVYHFLTSVERNRELRSCCLLEQMISGVIQLVFSDIELTSKEISSIAAPWFGSIKKDTKTEKETELYLKAIVKLYDREFHKALLNAYKLDGIKYNIRVDGIEDDNTTDFQKSIEHHKKTRNVSKKIRENIVKIFSYNLIGELLEFWIGIYKEAYADLMAVLTMELSPKDYNSVFDLLTTVYHYDKFPIWSDLLRQYCVSKAVYTYLTRNSGYHDLASEWKQYMDELEKNCISYTEKLESDHKTMSVMNIQDQGGRISKCFDRYFNDCGKLFYRNIRSSSSWSKLQRIIRETKTERDKIIANILLGEIFNGGGENNGEL